MAERKRIALIYSLKKEWIGGTYYILNLISALNTLRDEDKPTIVVVCNSGEDFEYVKEYTKYEFLEYFEYDRCCNILVSLFNKILFKLFDRMPFRQSSLPLKIFLLFPYNNPAMLSDKYATLSWIPDFQEIYYPQFFSRRDIVGRDKMVKCMIHAEMPILFSSQNALEDFEKFYPYGNRCRTFVMHFAVSLPERRMDKDREILDKYDAHSLYFFCANQFWQHKNHLTLFKAVKLLKEKGVETTVFFSGNPFDYRNPDYYPKLQSFVKENDLERNIRILGFMNRSEQLCLMAHSAAIIQPSLFEGWSTVVEDAKALHKYVILSDIPLHREQLSMNVSFFNPQSSEDLAVEMEEVLFHKPIMTDYDYTDDVRVFGETFKKIMDEIA